MNVKMDSVIVSAFELPFVDIAISPLARRLWYNIQNTQCSQHVREIFETKGSRHQ